MNSEQQETFVCLCCRGETPPGGTLADDSSLPSAEFGGSSPPGSFTCIRSAKVLYFSSASRFMSNLTEEKKTEDKEERKLKIKGSFCHERNSDGGYFSQSKIVLFVFNLSVLPSDSSSKLSSPLSFETFIYFT